MLRRRTEGARKLATVEDADREHEQRINAKTLIKKLDSLGHAVNRMNTLLHDMRVNRRLANHGSLEQLYLEQEDKERTTAVDSDIVSIRTMSKQKHMLELHETIQRDSVTQIKMAKEHST